MTTSGYIQLALFLGLLAASVRPLGAYMARVYQAQPIGLDRVLGPIERLIYRLCGLRPADEMDWKTYATAALLFNAAGLLALYALQRTQGVLPLNPQEFSAVPPDLAFNTAVSFATNADWQSYSGESTLSYLVQMLGLTVQNFVPAATGMAVLVALVGGLARRSAATIGNFWADLVRSTLYILLPLSLIMAVLLVSQGVVQTFSAYKTVALVQPAMDASGKAITEQTLALGPPEARRYPATSSSGRRP